MTKPADSFISDLMMTIRFYTNRQQSDDNLEELTGVAEHMIATLANLRRNQVMRETIARTAEMAPRANHSMDVH